MSNHHSDIDVDDVLSSVRRLVADESDEERRKRQEQAADRLVLTPSLRVADPEEGEADADDGATIDAELDEATKLPEASEDEVADPAVVEEDALDEAFEEEQLSQIDGAEQVDADPVDEPTDEAETLTAELQSLENETLADEEVALLGPTETSLRAISLEDRIAELEAAVNAQRDEFEPDGSEDQAQHVPDTALQSSPEIDEAEAESVLEVEEEAEEAVEPAIEDEAVVEPEVSDFDEPVVEEEEPIEAEATLDIGPAAALSFRHRGFGAPPATETVAPDVEEAVEVEEAANAEETVAHDTPEPAPSDDAILDEDALRELVGQLVRQELQGDLGERITRNVRKLVRREIQIALAARSLEKD